MSLLLIIDSYPLCGNLIVIHAAYYVRDKCMFVFTAAATTTKIEQVENATFG